MRKLLFRSRSGEGYPMVIAVTLCLLMLFMVILFCPGGKAENAGIVQFVYAAIRQSRIRQCHIGISGSRT